MVSEDVKVILMISQKLAPEEQDRLELEALGFSADR